MCRGGEKSHIVHNLHKSGKNILTCLGFEIIIRDKRHILLQFIEEV